MLLIVANFAGVEREITTGTPLAGKYKEIFNSDNAKYGGTGIVNNRVKRAKAGEWDDRPYSVTVKMAPLSLSILKYIPYTMEELRSMEEVHSMEEVRSMEEVHSVEESAEKPAVKAEKASGKKAIAEKGKASAEKVASKETKKKTAAGQGKKTETGKEPAGKSGKGKSSAKKTPSGKKKEVQ